MAGAPPPCRGGAAAADGVDDDVEAKLFWENVLQEDLDTGVADIKKEDSESACPPAPGQGSRNLGNGLQAEGELRHRHKPHSAENTVLSLNTQTTLQHHSQAQVEISFFPLH